MASFSILLVVIGFSRLAVYVQMGENISCFTCNSTNSTACGDPFEPQDALLTDGCAVCVKQKTKVTSKRKRAVRSRRTSSRTTSRYSGGNSNGASSTDDTDTDSMSSTPLRVEFYNLTVTWDDAKIICENKPNRTLATFIGLTNDILDYIYMTYPDLELYPDIWLGATDDDRNGYWLDGSELHRSWELVLTDPEETCLRIHRDGSELKLWDKTCEQKYPFMCTTPSSCVFTSTSNINVTETILGGAIDNSKCSHTKCKDEKCLDGGGGFECFAVIYDLAEDRCYLYDTELNLTSSGHGGVSDFVYTTKTCLSVSFEPIDDDILLAVAPTETTSANATTIRSIPTTTIASETTTTAGETSQLAAETPLIGAVIPTAAYESTNASAETPSLSADITTNNTPTADVELPVNTIAAAANTTTNASTSTAAHTNITQDETTITVGNTATVTVDKYITTAATTIHATNIIVDDDASTYAYDQTTTNTVVDTIIATDYKHTNTKSTSIITTSCGTNEYQSTPHPITSTNDAKMTTSELSINTTLVKEDIMALRTRLSNFTSQAIHEDGTSNNADDTRVPINIPLLTFTEHFQDVITAPIEYEYIADNRTSTKVIGSFSIFFPITMLAFLIIIDIPTYVENIVGKKYKSRK